MQLKLSSDFSTRLLDLLAEIDQLNDRNNRELLLRGLPKGPVRTISRADAMFADLNNILNAAEGWGRLQDSGEWALVIIAKNARRFLASGTQIGEQLEALYADLETAPAGDVQIVEEIVIGQDERLPVDFLAKGLRAAQAVAKVLVPRVINGQARPEAGSGSGWLIAPNLLMTNHHVIEMRDRQHEAPATEDDLRAQAAKSTVWFDYVDREMPYIEYPCVALEHKNAALDYALLRLAESPLSSGGTPLSGWGCLRIPAAPPPLRKGYRLNIIQHPQGGPKRIAIRSNFYVDPAPGSSDYIRYLTDTEPGSSGSPVLNDEWQVVALHHASVKVPTTLYKGAVNKYNNEGILIQAILNSLPEPLRQEILAANS